MKVTKEQAAQNRSRIVETAGRMFREKGFDGVGVSDLMRGAGMTHGGFYGHFPSKDDLMAQACAHALEGGIRKWEKLAEADPSHPLKAIVASYVSASHRDNPAQGCAIATLGVDVARQKGPIQRAFTEGLRPLIDILTHYGLGRSKALRRQKALATLATLAGAIILSRAVDDTALSDEILSAAAFAGQDRKSKAI